MTFDADVLVIGGGPAGSTAAALLASRGLRVVVVERERFPRFHIGESLLPMSLPVLNQMGIDLASAGHQYKAGARFLDERTGQQQTYLFADGLPGHPSHAYQVERAIFDDQLLRAARDAGAEIVHQTVESLESAEDHIQVVTDRPRYRVRYVVDATGQQAFIGRRNRTVVALREFGRAAAFFHYQQLSDEAWEMIQPDGNIEVLRVADGWAWAIPLSGRRLSVGVVRREGKIDADRVETMVAGSPLLRRLTRGAEHTAPRLIGDYSYRNTRSHGPRWVCVGDSACFLDPVFSSGVTLALQGAARMVELLAPALAEGREQDPGLMRGLAAQMRPAYEGFFSLIHRFYNTAILDNLFFATDPEPIFRAGLITMLAGDAWRDDNPFQAMLTKSERHMPSFDPW